MIDKYMSWLYKYVSRETLLYLFFGLLAFLLSIALFYFINMLGFHVAVTNTISTAVTILFAFVTNKLWVFESRSTEWSVVVPEFLKFTSVRVLMFFFETFLLMAMVSYLGVYEPTAKIITTAFVVIGNYFMSKMAVFKKG